MATGYANKWGVGDGADTVMRPCITTTWFLSAHWTDINTCTGHEDNVFVDWIIPVYRDRNDCVEIH